MIFRQNDDGTLKIGVRQSWVNDALMCMERGRLAYMKPEFRRGSDATVLGTAMHTAIEQVLLGKCDINDIGDAAVFGLQQAMNSDERWTYTSLTPEDMRPLAIAMSQGWARDVAPHVEFGGIVEHKFYVPMNTIEHDGKEYVIQLEGTMDYVSPSGKLWDWKSAKRKYNQRELQKQNIQSQVYALAAVKSGLVSDWPVSFTFGVMIRKEKSEGSRTTVIRTARHGAWIERQITNLVSAALRLGNDLPWPQVDQGYLCSETWCPWWSVCKGAALTTDDTRIDESSLTLNGGKTNANEQR